MEEGTAQEAIDTASNSATSPFLARNVDVIGLFLASALTFIPILMGQILLVRDTAHWTLPLRRRMKETLLGGHLPGWDPTQAIGFPVVADPLIGTFYPPNLLFLLPDTGMIVSIDSLLHLVWGGLGMVLALRRFQLHPIARLVGGVAWSLSGVTVGMWTAGVILQAMSWLPWAALSGITLARLSNGNKTRRESIRITAFCALPTAMGFLQGELFIATMGVGVSIWFGISTLWHDAGAAIPAKLPIKAVRRLFASGALSMALALLLSSANWIVVGMALNSTGRKTKLPIEMAELWSFHPLRFVEMVAMGAMGRPFLSQPGAKYIGDNQGEFLTMSVYLGISVVALAVTGLAARSFRRLAWATVALGTCAMLLAMGKHLPIHGLFRMVPPFGQMRYPEKYLVVAIVAVCTLAALGAHRVLTASANWRLFLIGPAAMGILLLANGLFPEPIRPFLKAGSVYAVVTATVFVGIVFLGPHRNRIARFGLPVVVLLDLVIPSISTLHFVPSALALRRPPIVDVIKSGRRNLPPALPARLYRDEFATTRAMTAFAARSYTDLESMHLLSLVSVTGGPYGIANVIGYDAAVPRNWELISTANSERFVIDFVRFASTDFILGSVNGWASRAGYLPAGIDPIPGLRLFKVTDALPRSFVVTMTTPFKTRNPGEVLNRDVLAGKLAMTQPEDADAVLHGTETEGGQCRIDDYRDDALSATCNSNTDGMAVFVEQHAPGWEARVDGRPAKIFRVKIA